MKRFTCDGTRIGMRVDEKFQALKVSDFLVLEPEFVYDPSQRELWEKDDEETVKHIISDGQSQKLAPLNLDNRELYVDRMAAGAYLPPEPEPTDPDPEEIPPFPRPDPEWIGLSGWGLEFSLGESGAAAGLYQSISLKVAQSGSPPIHDAWNNLKISIATRDPIGIAKGLGTLEEALTQAGFAPTKEDVIGSVANGDPYDGWNTLCDNYDLPPSVDIGDSTLPFRLTPPS